QDQEGSTRQVLLEMEESGNFSATCKKSYYIVFAWRPFILSLDFLNTEVSGCSCISKWPYYFPRPLMAFSLILSICMGIALAALCGWHYYLICTAQTTVEFYNNYYDRNICKSQGEIFINMYDFGVKENVRRFFNIGEQYPWYTVLFPVPIPPRGTGRVFEKCEAFYSLPASRQHDQLRSQQEIQDLEDIKDI
ncbi:uncharacterized protein BYT42DRAFT_506349, partial [Radiomyces spectabilis]|uniref:uncharacterized protein n=1 Tax=Radiomyces spectabilis TaxID=64574 RepID=UPI00221FDB2C